MQRISKRPLDYPAQRCWFRHNKGSQERSPNVSQTVNEHEHEEIAHENIEQDFPPLPRSKRPPITEERKNIPTHTLMEELINLMKQFITKC